MGKVAWPMMQATKRLLEGIKIDRQILLTKSGYLPQDLDRKAMQVFEAGHPIPDEQSLKASELIINSLSTCDSSTLVILLTSGGTSSLLCSPAGDLSLDDKQVLTHELISNGANITEINTVRIHCSLVKGGRLAFHAFPAYVVNFILSDVIGNSLGVIASGPTFPDSSSYHEALQILNRFDLKEKVPNKIIKHLRRGMAGKEMETPKEQDPIFQKVNNILIGTNDKALEKMEYFFQKQSLPFKTLTNSLQGSTQSAANYLVNEVKTVKNKQTRFPFILLSGGETTVDVNGKGKGGRNTQLALEFAMAMESEKDFYMLSTATDGSDGPTDAAGAFVNDSTLKRAREKGIDPEASLLDNDSYNFFATIGDLFKTGPTTTNIMDLQIIVVMKGY